MKRNEGKYLFRAYIVINVHTAAFYCDKVADGRNPSDFN